MTEGVTLVNPMEFPNTVINSPAGQAAIKYKLRGVNSTICCGLSSGLQAINYAAEFLRLGRARVLLAGGVEELCEESLGGFQKTGIASPTGKLQPFGSGRDGTIPGEGSALWVMETEEGAAAKGRTPTARSLRLRLGADAHSIQAYNVRGEGAADAIAQALESSGIGPEQVACIIASANGSRTGDEMEARALKKVFGARLGEIPACAPKAAFGECMGVSGALCAVVAALALEHQCAPPTAGLHGHRIGTQAFRRSAAGQRRVRADQRFRLRRQQRFARDPLMEEVKDLELTPADLLPRLKDQGYDAERVAQPPRVGGEAHRRASCEHIGSMSFDPEITRGNIENLIGVAQIPMGVAGPVLVHGQYAQGLFYVPMATTEGALLRSYERGMVALTKAGGVQTAVLYDENQMAPTFFFDSRGRGAGVLRVGSRNRWRACGRRWRPRRATAS